MSEAMDIGTRWEPLIDRALIDRLDGAVHRLHPPVRREVVLEMNGPAECSTSCYFNLFRDGEIARLYYRGYHPGADGDGSKAQTANIAQSVDGIHFTRPNLGLIECEGSTANNVVHDGVGAHNFHVFRDDNPAARPAERYKAVGGGWQKLCGFVSPDGLRWKMAQEEPLPVPGTFDSLNVAFWDARLGRYRLFSRYFDNDHGGVRAIQSCESEDFLHWTDPVPHQYGEGVPWEQFYTNATVPCPGAEHILLSFPKRFVKERTKDTDGMVYPGDGISEGVFMTSRDGVHWDRTFMQAWLRPGLDPRNWSHRSNMPAVGILETAPGEWSLYASEHYGWDTCRLRRLTVRRHGLASVNAGYEGGAMTTRPIVFAGAELRVNYATSAVGSVAVEVLDEAGASLARSEPIFGDELDANLLDVAEFAGRPVRLRFEMKDADLFALRTA